MEENAYADNQHAASLDVKETTKSNLDLASRFSRWIASGLDSLILSLFVITPLIVLSILLGDFDRLEEINPQKLIFYGLAAFFGFATFVILNFKPLVNNGQTMGKKLLLIKIVDLEGNLPSRKMLFKRYLLYLFIGQIPIVGWILDLVNVLFIFDIDKRCLHDYFAGTHVVNKS